ncbi:MAG: hypothetical protein ACOWWR_17990 [Eubacteriales bacterium]
MNNESFDKLINEITEITQKAGSKTAKRLDLKLLERATKKLYLFSKNCAACESYLMDLDIHIKSFNNQLEHLQEMDIKNHQCKVKEMISHLQKQHGLVSEGYYVDNYMTFGMSLGLIAGLLLLNNLALGLTMGMCLGLIFGSMKDAQAKKKGLTL